MAVPTGTKAYAWRQTKATVTDTNGKTLSAGTDYVIVPGSYSKNINKGTASVTLRGMGDYYGTYLYLYGNAYFIEIITIIIIGILRTKTITGSVSVYLPEGFFEPVFCIFNNIVTTNRERELHCFAVRGFHMVGKYFYI